MKTFPLDFKTPVRVSVAILTALGIAACATPMGAPDASTKPPAAIAADKPAEAPAPTALPSIEEAFYANRGAESGLESLGFLKDFGGYIYALGVKTSDVFLFEATSGKFLNIIANKGKKFGPSAVLRATSNLVFVIDTENSRISLISHDFRNLPLGDLPFTAVKNPVAVEVVMSEVPAAVRFNFVVDTDGKRSVVQTDLTGMWGGRQDNFKPELAVFSAPKIMPLPASAIAGESAAIKTEPASLNLWVASGKSLHVLSPDGTPVESIAPFQFETPVYGIDLMTCRRGDQLGYWMIATQPPSSGAPAPFYMLDRGTLKPAGGFTSAQISAPSDMVFRAQPIAEFLDGAVFVANAGTGVIAVDWNAIATANNLRKRCF